MRAHKNAEEAERRLEVVASKDRVDRITLAANVIRYVFYSMSTQYALWLRETLMLFRPLFLAHENSFTDEGDKDLRVAC